MPHTCHHGQFVVEQNQRSAHGVLACVTQMKLPESSAPQTSCNDNKSDLCAQHQTMASCLLLAVVAVQSHNIQITKNVAMLRTDLHRKHHLAIYYYYVTCFVINSNNNKPSTVSQNVWRVKSRLCQ